MFDTQHNKPVSQQVTAAPVRAHVERLLGAGYTPAVIARLAGVQLRRVLILLGDRTERGTARADGTDGSHRISRRIAEPLLAIPVPDGTFIPACGPVRRLRGLVRLGYPIELLARELGYPETLLGDVTLHEPEIVDTEFAEAVAALFDRWHYIPGPSDEAREFGRRHRFAAPLAWALPMDDDEFGDDEFDDVEPDPAGQIDDPDAEPYGLPPSDDNGWRRVPSDFAEMVADHRDLGHYDEEIAEALGISLNTFAKRIHRAGLSERRRGDGNHKATPPIYGARYTVRLPRTLSVLAS